MGSLCMCVRVCVCVVVGTAALSPVHTARACACFEVAIAAAAAARGIIRDERASWIKPIPSAIRIFLLSPPLPSPPLSFPLHPPSKYRNHLSYPMPPS